MPKKKFQYIPDRWENYSNVGAKVPGTKFIAFKVPLSKHRDWNLPELKNSVPELKSIIDLTNTSRYYQPKHCEELDLQYRKIFIPGRVVPTQTAVQQFYSAVEDFTALDPNGLIGVHCTHGLNRTGYMICRYLIEKDGVEPDLAISAFDNARGHKQERENYLQHLRSRGWENDSNDVEVPEVNKEESSSNREQRHNGSYHQDRKHNYKSNDHYNRNNGYHRDYHHWTPNREYHGYHGRQYNDNSYNGYDRRSSYNRRDRRGDYENSWRRDNRSSWRRDDRNSDRRYHYNDWRKDDRRQNSGPYESSSSTSYDKS